jgi:signal transduction histidine kinase
MRHGLKRALGAMPADVDARVRHLNDAINRGVELKRGIIEELRPSSLNNLGLSAALEILVREFASRSEASISAEMEPVALSESAAITDYRVVQEALTNAIRHAAATQIRVTLEAAQADTRASGQSSAHVMVQDNGRGFDARTRGTPHGLMGLRYRIEAEGGELALHSTPSGGTRLEAWLPLQPQTRPDAPSSDSRSDMRRIPTHR